MKKILVTGGAGYIGSHMVLSLLKNGYQPVVLDNFSNSSKKNLSTIEKELGVKIEVIEKDLKTDLSSLIIPEVEAIIHFAASKAVGESVEKPLEYYSNNVYGLLNLLNWAKQNQVKKLVFSSTSAVYGQPKDIQVTELSEVKPESPYGASKAMCERIIQDYCATGNMSAVILRYFNVAGNSTNPLIGDLDSNPKSLLPSIAMSQLGIRPFKFTVFGTDYPTKDGSAIRDYIHVQDLVDGHLCGLEFLNSNSGVNIFNLGNGVGTSVLEIVKSFENASGEPLEYIAADRRAGDVAAIFSNPAKANSDLDWNAKRSIEEMVDSTLNWYKNGLNKSE